MVKRVEFSKKVRAEAFARGERDMRSKGKGLRWLESMIGFQGSECVEWPFSKRENGYPQIVVGYKRTTANRIICTLAKGPPENNSLQAAHECGNRACCNPNHISWKTPQDNILDKNIHGTQKFGQDNYNAKMTNSQVVEIKKLIGEGRLMQKEIASIFGVAPMDVSEIKRGIRWRRVG